VKLKKIHIENYKSLVDLEIIEPNPFTVFAGPNGSGKSNIFEALEYMSYYFRLKSFDVEALFGGNDAILNFNLGKSNRTIEYVFEKFTSSVSYKYLLGAYMEFNITPSPDVSITDIFLKNHLRLFIKTESLKRIKYTSDKKLLPDASNIEAIIKDILSNGDKDEFIDWIELFVPGFESIEIHSDNISGRDSLLIYEKGTKKPFTKNLISDGTYNILCLLAAVYQAKDPQFLCIEEPENGLNPYVVRSLIEFFRNQCKEKGHYIWLNTHSATLVKELRPEELILVDKVDGDTKIKQFTKDHNIYSLEMDEAWLSNALGGGIPW